MTKYSIERGINFPFSSQFCSKLSEPNEIYYKNKNNAFLIITHYQRLLDYIKPDFVHVLSKGVIAKTGSSELANELEKTGYKNFS